MSVISIQIVGWEKYNPKRAQKSYSWFRFDNYMPSDAAFADLNSDQKWTFVCLLCEASKNNREIVQINSKIFKAIVDLSDQQLSNALDKLQSLQLIKIVTTPALHQHYTDATPALHQLLETTTPTNERTNERRDMQSPPNKFGPEALAVLWNASILDPKVLNPTKLSPKRKKAAEQRLKEFPDQEFWRQVFSKIPKTPFLRGENDRKWKASFDWLLRPDSATKVMEGFYGKTDAEVNPLSEPPPHRDIFANYKPRGDNAI